MISVWGSSNDSISLTLPNSFVRVQIFIIHSARAHMLIALTNDNDDMLFALPTIQNSMNNKFINLLY